MLLINTGSHPKQSTPDDISLISLQKECAQAGAGRGPGLCVHSRGRGPGFNVDGVHVSQ
ncbi:unnamed protein product [Rhodiola kirilowii]